MSVVDLFAGLGGWDHAARQLGIDPLGIEWNADACATREAVGLRTLHADISALDPADFAPCEGLIASPPCQDFSVAGKGAGREGDRGQLVDEVMRWTDALRPRWVACEQVPPVLPIWREFAHEMRALGYDTWVGVLDSADFGVPQNRRRAVLLADRTAPVQLPTPSHARCPGMFNEAHWVTMSDAVRLPPGCRYISGQNSRGPRGTVVRYVRSCDRPAGTLTTKSVSQWVVEGAGDRRKLTHEDALTLQGFPADLPVQGTVEARNRQIGNAIPPPLAKAILAQLVTP